MLHDFRSVDWDAWRDAPERRRIQAVEEMDGRRQTDLLANREDENDMFIPSRWDAREDAMAFFRSPEFAEIVEWGRDVLTDRPRHIFLA